MHYVIVGAGPAGVIAAETLRKTDSKGQITIIGDEPEPPYSRMAIPYLLVDRIEEGGTHLRKDADHYDQLGIEIKHDRVINVETEANRVDLEGGAAVDYDRLLVATGSKPVLPPVPGIDSPGVLNCWTLEDARRIIEHAKPGARVTLIGAGFIGCIILEALASRGVTLTVVEMGDRMVPRMMNETAGGLIKSWCEHKGIRVLTSTGVSAVDNRPGREQEASGGLKAFFARLTGTSDAPADREPDGLHVSLSSGEVLEADLVISAAGVKPSIEFLESSGVETDAGILIDNCFRSNIDNIYAAGDVAQGRDFSTGNFEVHAIQPTASEHGRIAALNMAGHETHYGGSLNMNVLDTVGLVSSSFGLWMGVKGGDSTELTDRDNYRYLNLQFQDDVLVGATSLGLTQHVGVLRGLIQGKTPLGRWKDKLVADPTRVMEAYLDCNHAYG